MVNRWEHYRSIPSVLPAKHLTWPFRGAGLENLGSNGQPVSEDLPPCEDDQLLVRVDAVGICATDAKMVRLGDRYPLFFARDFTTEPTRLGHEAAMTVMKVGKRWQDLYHLGQRLAIQADVYHRGQRLVLGVNIPGAMAQYMILPHEVLEGDEGSYVFEVPDWLSYAEVALLEPWACVEAAYSSRRRLDMLPGGTLWMRGRPGIQENYYISHPIVSRRIVLTDVPDNLVHQICRQSVEVHLQSGTEVDEQFIVEEFTAGQGFDDIVLLDPRTTDLVERTIGCVHRQGCVNIVASEPLNGRVSLDVGRLHYGPVAYVGCKGPDIAEAYGIEHNRSELRANGTTLVIGAGGSMGHMHVQRALWLLNGPSIVIANDISARRLESLQHKLDPSRSRNAIGPKLVTTDAPIWSDTFAEIVDRETNGRGCDDIVILVPDVSLIEEAVSFLAPDGMLVLFAGVPIGTRASLPLDNIYLHGAQYTGSSGSTVSDEMKVLAKVVAGDLSPASVLAAVAGMNALPAAMRAVMDGKYPGKVMLYPHLIDLPLLSLAEMRTMLPEVYARLGVDETWTFEAEQTLFELYL